MIAATEWLPQAQNQLNAYRTAGPEGEEYPPAIACIEITMGCLQLLADREAPEPRIVADHEAGLSLEWRGSPGAVSLHFDPFGRAVAQVFDAEGKLVNRKSGPELNWLMQQIQEVV